MSLGRFGRIVRQVLETLPAELKQHLDNMVVDVQEEPDPETLRHLDFTEEEIAAGESLYGLFDPLPLPDTSGLEFDQLPHRIIIYKRPLEEDYSRTPELREEIRKTVIHELAHHFGYSERDLEKWTNVS
jgi:predicted Zn-dependent protease with MMP-like domain